MRMLFFCLWVFSSNTVFFPQSDDEHAEVRGSRRGSNSASQDLGALLSQMLRDVDLHLRQLMSLRSLAQSASDTKRTHIIAVLTRKHVKQRQYATKMMAQPMVEPSAVRHCQDELKELANSQQKVCVHFQVEYPPPPSLYPDNGPIDYGSLGQNGPGSGAGIKAAGGIDPRAMQGSTSFLTHGFSAVR